MLRRAPNCCVASARTEAVPLARISEPSLQSGTNSRAAIHRRRSPSVGMSNLGVWSATALRKRRSTVFTYHRGVSLVFTAVLLISGPSGPAQEAGRTKVADGEYRVTMEGDLGCGPIETEIFHFSESWTLWRTAAGYDLEGHRTYESPRDRIHDDRFVAKLAPDLRLL